MGAARLLRYARARSGLSQRELAVRAGVAQPLVARLERGRSEPRTSTLERLLQACGYRLEIAPMAGEGIDRTGMRELQRLTPAGRLQNATLEARNLDALVSAPSARRRAARRRPRSATGGQ